ncbi:hypothetical protein [Variovorax sp. E3]|uniref:DUF968 domain-containing protein n=1 Tax=Variovorax sp. E3 TaxID=1914993 RepID=UPI0018DBEEF6|nr:hypothetical protein [Variovorax sp. E3]
MVAKLPNPDRAVIAKVMPVPGRIVRVVAINDGEFAPAPKQKPMRDEVYRRLVAARPCIRCGIQDYSQAAHPNTGKGTGTKADDRNCFPLCADRPGMHGCHSLFDQGAAFTKDERRQVEQVWTRQTQSMIGRQRN